MKVEFDDGCGCFEEGSTHTHKSEQMCKVCVCVWEQLLTLLWSRGVDKIWPRPDRNINTWRRPQTLPCDSSRFIKCLQDTLCHDVSYADSRGKTEPASLWWLQHIVINIKVVLVLQDIELACPWKSTKCNVRSHRNVVLTLTALFPITQSTVTVCFHCKEQSLRWGQVWSVNYPKSHWI